MAPSIFTTPDGLSRLRSRITSRQQPFYEAWSLTKQEADAALTKNYAPAQHYHHREYFEHARRDARDVRNLALLFHITGNKIYADKGVKILRLWADNALTSDYPSRGSRHSAGLVIGRVIPIFADGYAMLHQEMTRERSQEVEAWFRAMVAPIRESQQIWRTANRIDVYGTVKEFEPPWLGNQRFNNHLSAHNLGLLAIGLATEDEKLSYEAEHGPDNPRNLRTLMEGVILMAGDMGSLYHEDPTLTDGWRTVQDGEMYDRYRVQSGDGLRYSFLALRLLTLQAEIIKHNHLDDERHDWFAWTGPRGENLRLAFEFYSAFYTTESSSARGGYYSTSQLATPEHYAMPLYEIAAREYPDSDEIRSVLKQRNRVQYDNETFGWTCLLTNGGTYAEDEHL